MADLLKGMDSIDEFTEKQKEKLLDAKEKHYRQAKNEFMETWENYLDATNELLERAREGEKVRVFEGGKKLKPEKAIPILEDRKEMFEERVEDTKETIETGRELLENHDRI